MAFHWATFGLVHGINVMVPRFEGPVPHRRQVEVETCRLGKIARFGPL